MDRKSLKGFYLLVNNSLLSPEGMDKILQINISEYINPPNSFSIEVFDPSLDIISPVSKKETITEGSIIEIFAEYQGLAQKVMTGEVASVSLELSAAGKTSIQIEGFDLLHRLTRGTHYRKFEGSDDHTGMPDSDIAGIIADEMKLKLNADPTPELKTARVQNNISDFAFLNSLAETNGYYLWVEDDVLYFKKERTVKKTQTFEWGKNLLDFSARLSTTGLVNKIVIQGRDNKQAENYTYTKERSLSSLKELSKTGAAQLERGSGGKSAIEVSDPRVYSLDNAKRYADKLMKEQERFITAAASVPGNCDIKAGMTVEIKNVGRFEGNYHLEEVSHSFGISGYKTSFQARKII